MKYFFEYFIHISEKDVNCHIFKINITGNSHQHPN